MQPQAANTADLKDMNEWEQRAARDQLRVPVWYVGDINEVIAARKEFESAGNSDSARIANLFRPGAYAAGGVGSLSLGAGMMLSGVAQNGALGLAAGAISAAAVMGVSVWRASAKRSEQENAALLRALNAFGKGLENHDSKAEVEPTVGAIKHAQSSTDAFEQALAKASLAPNQMYDRLAARQKAKIKAEIERVANAPVETPEMRAERGQATINSLREKAKERQMRERQGSTAPSAQTPAAAAPAMARRRMGM